MIKTITSHTAIPLGDTIIHEGNKYRVLDNTKTVNVRIELIDNEGLLTGDNPIK